MLFILTAKKSKGAYDGTLWAAEEQRQTKKKIKAKE